jgi:UDPglucose 6-dehydrogenase
MRICVVGSGYVGLVIAACFAELGHQVHCVDLDSAKIDQLNAGIVPIHEDFLHELIVRHSQKHLNFSTGVVSAVAPADAVFITVGTPVTRNGAADLSYVESVVCTVAKAGGGYKVLVEKSTVPVYTSEWIRRSMILNGRGRQEFDVVSNPEFLREGSAVTDFLYPDRIVVGTDSERAAALMKELYAPLVNGSYAQASSGVPAPDGRGCPRYIETTPQNAELIKHASNAFLAMKVSFINAVANICEAVGADVLDVAEGIGSDHRIGSEFFRPGIGYGGSCFPKDVAAFRTVARELGYDFALLDEIRKINEKQKEIFLCKIKSALWTLKDKRVGILGLAFKGGTDDIRESPAISIVESLLREACRVSAFDPAAAERARQVFGGDVFFAKDPYTAAENADALLILTDWAEFRTIDLPRLRAAMKYPIVLDGRNLFEPGLMHEHGFTYYSVGREPVGNAGLLRPKRVAS